MSVDRRPLSAHDADAVIAIGPAGAITAGAFYHRASRLAEALPHGQYVLNTCQDRYLFMLGLAAALIQGQRDFFGAHTYRRIDKDGVFHTLWSGDRTEVEV